MENYKKNYKDSMKKIEHLYESVNPECKQIIEYYFPELKESEDERIRKEILEYFHQFENEELRRVNISDWIAWLKKQGEQKPEEVDNLHNYLYNDQKPVDKVEPKFKAGDWIINSEGTLRHILAVGRTGYETNKGWLTHDIYENGFHLWTIQDAKDGDILVDDNSIIIFRSIGNNRWPDVIDYYVGYKHNLGKIVIQSGNSHYGIANTVTFKPAAKEQRDLLFQKMKEASYEWDSEKKELKKIERKPKIKDDVLLRFAFYQYDDDTLYLSNVFVEECNRKHGYGTKILKVAEEVAKTFEVSKIRLKVEKNTWMEEWYKKNGYEYLSLDGKYDWLEKRVEQKPADKVEPKFKVGDIITNKKSKDTVKIVQILHDSYCYSGWDGAATVHSDFRISEQDNWELVEQKPAWSKEDEKMWSTISDLLWEGFKLSDGKVSWDKIRCWLLPKIKSLKERMQTHPKQEWSEKDEKLYTWCASAIQNRYNDGLFTMDEYRETSLWLKSLKERYTWKPSDNHISVLNEVINFAASSPSMHWNEYIYGVLYNLRSQLKKLKGE